MKKVTFTLIAVLCASTLFLAGCGKGNGGANSETTITVKPAQPAASGSGEAAAGGEETPAASGGGAPAEGFGTLVGTVSFDGTVPVLDPLVAQGAAVKDTVCSAQAVPDESLVVNDGKLANVFVFLEKAPAGAKSEAPTEPVVFDQKGCRFLPHAISVRAGQPLQILNDDPIAHNTHTMPDRSPQFNSIIGTNDRVGATTSYGRSEKIPVEVKCDIHAWMRAWHLVLDHPFGAITGADGTFRIEGLPAGEHEFRVWHERGGYLDRKLKVTIKPDEETTVDLKFGADKFASFDGPRPKTVLLSSR